MNIGSRLAVVLLGALVGSSACSGPSSPAATSTTPLAAATPAAEDDEAEVGEPAAETDEPDEADDAEYEYGKFVGFELVTGAPADAAAFWGGLLGWQMTPSGGGFEIRNGERAIGRIVPPAGDAVPIGWLSWISVEDVEDLIRDVLANGGRQVVAPRKVDGGLRAIVAGPTGGVFGIVHADAGDAPDRAPGAGDWYWAQLWTDDFEEALGFYEVVGSYNSIEYTVGKTRYRVLQNDERSRAVIVGAPPGQKSRWVPFVVVADVAATVARGRKLKAKILTAPQTIGGIGTFAIVQAPTGGILGVIAPAADSGD